MEKNGMNKEVMILIELQAFLLKLERVFFLRKLSYKKKKYITNGDISLNCAKTLKDLYYLF